MSEKRCYDCDKLFDASDRALGCDMRCNICDTDYYHRRAVSRSLAQSQRIMELTERYKAALCAPTIRDDTYE